MSHSSFYLVQNHLFTLFHVGRLPPISTVFFFSLSCNSFDIFPSNIQGKWCLFLFLVKQQLGSRSCVSVQTFSILQRTHSVAHGEHGESEDSICRWSHFSIAISLCNIYLYSKGKAIFFHNFNLTK